MKKEIAKRNWDYVLYEENGNYVFKVAFFDKPIDYTRIFYLTDKEYTTDELELSKLSEKIRNNYEEFKSREISSPD